MPARPSSLDVPFTQALPPFLAALVQRLVAAGVYPPHRAPNHVLVNDYRIGAGIPAHADGPLYWPVVATITLAGPALIAFTRGADAARHPGGELVAEVCTPATQSVWHCARLFLRAEAAKCSQCVEPAARSIGTRPVSCWEPARAAL